MIADYRRPGIWSVLTTSSVRQVPGRAEVALVHGEVGARLAASFVGHRPRLRLGPIPGLRRPVGAPVRPKARSTTGGSIAPRASPFSWAPSHRASLWCRCSSQRGDAVAPRRAAYVVQSRRAMVRRRGKKGRTRRVRTSSILRQAAGWLIRGAGAIGVTDRRATWMSGRGGPVPEPGGGWPGSDCSATMTPWQRP